MELNVTRETFTEVSTIGRLEIDGAFQCWTLEDVVRPAGVKVPGRTAIPVGVYEVVLSYSQRFGRYLPLLLNVPMFEGIRIHAGNRSSDTEGCLLVGETKGPQPDWIGNSRAALSALLPTLQEAMTREKVWIAIRGAQ